MYMTSPILSGNWHGLSVRKDINYFLEKFSGLTKLFHIPSERRTKYKSSCHMRLKLSQLGSF